MPAFFKFQLFSENLKNLEDVRCDNDGNWINNGVRKIYLCIDHHKKKKAQHHSHLFHTGGV